MLEVVNVAEVKQVRGLTNICRLFMSPLAQLNVIM
jgi:hypothetical protein